MPTQREEPDGKARGQSPVAVTLLHALGVIDLVATPCGILAILVVRARQPEVMGATFVTVLLILLLVGVALGGLLFGLAALVQSACARNDNLYRGRDAGRELQYYSDNRSVVGARASATPAGEAGDNEVWERLLNRLTEIRDIMQVSSETTSGPRERLRSHLQRNAAEEIITAINTRRLGRARVLLRDAEAAYGKTPTLERLHTKIDAATVRNEPLDYGFTRRVVEEAINDGRWSLAEQCAQTLFFDHPTSPRCRRLWDDTRRARLYTHIQARVAEHHWAEALAATEEFLERFPGSVEADALKGRIETMRSNAEIVRRKQFETKFKELIAAHNYPEALRIAKHVVDQYPESPQSAALRDQIPLLERRVSR
ncbi:MAG: hypothetical protein ACE5HE_00345 [Phycisphaerae bacterium]